MPQRVGQIKFIHIAWRRQQYRGKKGGERLGYSGHKHQRGEKTLAIIDNSGNVIAPMTVQAVNHHDSVLFSESFNSLIETAELLDFDLTDVPITFDPAFDSLDTKNEILTRGMIPVIKPNLRRLKKRQSEIKS